MSKKTHVETRARVGALSTKSAGSAGRLMFVLLPDATGGCPGYVVFCRIQNPNPGFEFAL